MPWWVRWLGKGVLCFITQHIYFSSQACSGEGAVGALTELQPPGQHQGSAGSPLCFAFLFYPNKFWEIGKNLELGMVVPPVGFTLRVGEKKKPSVVT